MQSSDNRIIIASAGSGKTTFLIKEALSLPDRKILILTYTNNNINEIRNKFYKIYGGIPKHVDVMTWFSFLLHECARPYQRSVYSSDRVKTIYYPKGRSALYVPYNETERYYFKNGDEIYSDKIARFIIDCENNSKGLVTKRLADIYNEIYIDEFQDLSGWDLDLLEILLQVGIRMVIVGDPRQCTYTTNNSARNCQCCGMGMLDLICQWEANNLCCIEKLARSYRCNQQICDFADLLWPDMEKTVSHNHKTTDHDGIFIVSEDYIHEYVKTFFPKVLRYNKTANTYGYGAQNFGAVKGLEFERVLIIPHGPMKKYLHTGNLNDVRKSLELFYVAITRAKQSVAFLYDEKCGCGCIHWKPKLN